jgi:hypothetical protein
MDDVRALLPQDKMDTERAEALVALGYPAVIPVLPELMEWLQDTNWPVAQVVAPFLATIGLPLVPYIRQVFATDDEDWKMRVMRRLVETSPAIFDVVQENIREMAHTLPKNKDEEALRETAQEVLDHYSSIA